MKAFHDNLPELMGNSQNLNQQQQEAKCASSAARILIAMIADKVIHTICHPKMLLSRLPPSGPLTTYYPIAIVSQKLFPLQSLS